MHYATHILVQAVAVQYSMPQGVARLVTYHLIMNCILLTRNCYSIQTIQYSHNVSYERV